MVAIWTAREPVRGMQMRGLLMHNGDSAPLHPGSLLLLAVSQGGGQSVDLPRDQGADTPHTLSQSGAVPESAPSQSCGICKQNQALPAAAARLTMRQACFYAPPW